MLQVIINDIWKFLRANVDEDEHETNQNFIRMKYLFCGFIIKSWFDKDFRLNNFTEYNRIVIKHCMNYYVQYCYNRNDFTQN